MPTLCSYGRALRKNAAPCRLHPLSGAAAVQRGEKRIQGGSRGNSQSPYPSLAAGGSHAAAAAAKSGARTPPQNTQGNAKTQRNKPNICNNGGALSLPISSLLLLDDAQNQVMLRCELWDASTVTPNDKRQLGFPLKSLRFIRK